MLQALGTEPHTGSAGAVEGAGFVVREIGRRENGGVALARWAQTTEAQIQVSGVRLTDTVSADRYAAPDTSLNEILWAGPPVGIVEPRESLGDSR